MGGTRSIETRNKVHACMAHRWNKTKKQTVLRIRLGRDQGMSRCLVALSKRWKLALISRSVSSHRRAGNKTQNSSAALQTIVLPGTRQRRKRSCRRPGEQDSGALHSKRSKALPNQRSVPNAQSPPKLMLNDHCQVCEFRQRCHDQAVQEDNISLLRGMGEKEIKSYARKGIFSVTQLAHTFRPRRKGKKQVTDNAQAPPCVAGSRYQGQEDLHLRDAGT